MAHVGEVQKMFTWFPKSLTPEPGGASWDLPKRGSDMAPTS